METKTALIVGSAGLIGSHLLDEILKNEYYTEVVTWVRKPSGISHPKLKEVIVDFLLPDHFPHPLPNHIFCCLGTTIGKAGTQEAFRHVDLDLVVAIARQAEKSGSEKFLVVSSLGASKDSGNFYLKTKGEMEQKIQTLGIRTIVIFRPSMLLGNRKEFRFGELIGKGVMQAVGFLMLGPLKKYKGIEASTVAKAMVKIAKEETNGILILESDKIHDAGS